MHVPTCGEKKILLTHIELQKGNDTVQFWVWPLKAFKSMVCVAFDTVKKSVYVNVCVCMWQKADFGSKYVKVIYQKDGVNFFWKCRREPTQ